MLTNDQKVALRRVLIPAKRDDEVLAVLGWSNPGDSVRLVHPETPDVIVSATILGKGTDVLYVRMPGEPPVALSRAYPTLKPTAFLCLEPLN